MAMYVPTMPTDPRIALTSPIARAVRREIKKLGITHEEIAKELGISKAVISQICNRAIDSSRHLPRLFDYLGLPRFMLYPLDRSQRRLLEALERLRDARDDDQSSVDSDAVSMFVARCESVAAELLNDG